MGAQNHRVLKLHNTPAFSLQNIPQPQEPVQTPQWEANENGPSWVKETRITEPHPQPLSPWSPFSTPNTHTHPRLHPSTTWKSHPPKPSLPLPFRPGWLGGGLCLGQGFPLCPYLKSPKTCLMVHPASPSLCSSISVCFSPELTHSAFGKTEAPGVAWLGFQGHPPGAQIWSPGAPRDLQRYLNPKVPSEWALGHREKR